MVSSKFNRARSVQASPKVCHKGTGPYACIFPDDLQCPFSGWISFDGETFLGKQIIIRHMSNVVPTGPTSFHSIWFNDLGQEREFRIELLSGIEKVRMFLNVEDVPGDGLMAISEIEEVQNLDPWETGLVNMFAVFGFGSGFGAGMP